MLVSVLAPLRDEVRFGLGGIRLEVVQNNDLAVGGTLLNVVYPEIEIARVTEDIAQIVRSFREWPLEIIPMGRHDDRRMVELLDRAAEA